MDLIEGLGEGLIELPWLLCAAADAVLPVPSRGPM